MSDVNKNFFSVSQIADDFRLTYNRRKNNYFGDCPVCNYKDCFVLYEKDNGKHGWTCYAGDCNLWDAMRTSIYAHPVASKFKAPDKIAEPVTQHKTKKHFETILRESWNAPGTVVETYLRSRGCIGPIPECLRFHPGLYHSESGKTFPAMVAPITHYISQKTIGIQRTYLKPDGSGKADVKPVKKILGRLMSGGVFLGDPANVMAVAEGIETALSYQYMTGTPTVAALSCVGMRKLILPSKPMAQVVYIAADYDDAGLTAADKAAHYFSSERRTVNIAHPPNHGDDFNDVLMKSKNVRDGHVTKS